MENISLLTPLREKNTLLLWYDVAIELKKKKTIHYTQKHSQINTN